MLLLLYTVIELFKINQHVDHIQRSRIIYGLIHEIIYYDLVLPFGVE